MIHVFADESSDGTQERTFAIGAIIASNEEWVRLENKWSERTGGKVFHATDCESDQGLHSATSHSENKTLYKDLVTILAESKAWGFGAAYDFCSYRELFPAVDLEICYLRALLFIVNFFKGFSDRHFKDVVQFTFDRREQSNYWAGKIYSLMAFAPENRALIKEDLVFSSPSICPRLQMADLFTYEVRKELDNRIGPIVRPRRRSMQVLTKDERFGCDMFLREYFEDMKRKLPAVEVNDPAFTREAYRAWLEKVQRTDTTKNRLLFYIACGEQDQQEQGLSS